MTEKQDPVVVALREVAEAMLITQQEMGRDIADMAAVVVEHTQSTAILADAVLNATSRLGIALDKLEELEKRFGAYVQDTAKQESGIRQVDARLKALELEFGGKR